ncbi:activated Cdc42 kinase-like [Rhipicephalus sanguineus]|uniref:activated Cdc42 kinase-like n=1 Tax=Rhipicephalus sanguineus TaxID=34632 RepID=UPI001894FF51|nr:activated Cdc42 kinase-like [Rhipicephalus sanguineus]
MPFPSAASTFSLGSGGGPSLYEFLLEAELSSYYDALRNDLKVVSVGQLKYVEEDDLLHLGMSRPEQRRLRKYFHKYFPQTYLRKIKQMILPKAKDDMDQSSVLLLDTSTDKGSSSSQVRVPSKHIIPADSIVINKELGIGEFGVVQQGVWTNEEGDRIQVAIKCLSKDQMQNNPMEFLKEAVIMHTIDHEHIVRLYGVVLDSVSLMLVTELAPLRSLLECLKEAALRPSFPVMALCDFAMQICDGMQYLESKRLIHRDLAARNILVFAKNKVKISDFGLSRALGVGKDYYQTNFNVNLKLPIAWCAPECINFLRFTSASDVWAFGVTLWEMFSYGFQPWAALTGQQILEAIDEPNLQRLEQPDCCPKDYYTLMLKCWQHDPNKRPKFSEILQTLPDCKPEQVQAIADCPDTSMGGSLKLKKDALHYRTGDVITVLDKRPDAWSLWKGVTASGKTGFFNPAATIAYLGHNLPSSRASGSFTRWDPRSGAGTAYASGRRSRLRPEMISGPQGDLKHTGHVGLDGAFFGDVAFLGDKYGQLPKQVVNPYKPQEDKDSSDSSDMTPLLNGSSSTVDGKSGPALETWSDTSSEKDLAKEYILEKEICAKPLDLKLSNPLDVKSMSGKDGQKPDHEYHEISDEEQMDATESPKFETLDLGPSLMDEVFRALETTQLNFDLDKVPKGDCFAKSEPPKETPKPSSASGTIKKKQLATVKPISAAEEQTLETAIAIAKEAAAQSMQEMDGRSESDATQDSPRTPSSPNKRKFSFKFKSSPKLGRRTFSEEAEAIPDIQDSLTDEAKEAYNSLVDKGPEKLVLVEPAVAPASMTVASIEALDADMNPLRRIRSGIQIQPRVRGNRHGIPSSCRPTTPHTAALARLAANAVSTGGAPRNGLGAPPPPPPLQQQAEAEANPLPLPPRDRTRPAQVLKHHQRKHPLLLLPGSVAAETACKDSGSESPPSSVRQASVNDRIAAVEARTSRSEAEPHFPPAKPVRTCSNPDDSFENQIQEEIDSLDHLATDAPSPPTIYKNSDHVSCEDLLEFAMDRPNAKRTQGPARGVDSDEVRIMQKVLAKECVGAEECLVALNEVDWDVHKGIKWLRLQQQLRQRHGLAFPADACSHALEQSGWNILQATDLLRATQALDDTTEV